LSIVAIMAWAGIAPASAEHGTIVNLKSAPADQQVEALGYCNRRYDVRLKDGSFRRFQEFDLSFKIDSGPNGPKPGVPTLVQAGKVGDRALVIFSGLEEMKTLPQQAC
jgi:hypothetical protein